MFGMLGRRSCDPKRVLIADDETTIRSLFQMILTTALPDVSIDLACNGLEAVRLFKEKRHAVITMDLRMPVMDGLGAFQAINKICGEENLQVPGVVFCTGFAPPKAVDEIVGDASLHGLLIKPIRSGDIVDAVANRLKLFTQGS